MSETEKILRIKKTAAVIGLLSLIFACIYILHIPCVILETTGFYCTACGTQRMLDRIFTLDFWGASRQNIFMIFALPLAFILMLVSVARYIKGKSPLTGSKAFKVFLVLFIAAAVVFMVLRNLPQFRFLAPV